jgi:hypothetical protein
MTRKSFFNEKKKVAFITSIYGNYEAECRSFKKQTIDTDFICFTDNPDMKPNGWIIDTQPYHQLYKSEVDDDTFTNSLRNNKHTFNIAKYYKQNFYNIPRLQEYDVIVWLDGSIEITNENVTKFICEKFQDGIEVILFEHEDRNGSLLKEMEASLIGNKYNSTRWIDQDQPLQDVKKQYDDYINDDYKDNVDENSNYGMWITCFIAFKNNENTKKFLDFWYLQTLKYTTQDQMSFAYSVQKVNVELLSLPDDEIKGIPHSKTDFYIKHNHSL